MRSILASVLGILTACSPGRVASERPTASEGGNSEALPSAALAAAFAGEVPAQCHGNRIDLHDLHECLCKNRYPPEVRDGRTMRRAAAYCEASLYGRDVSQAIAGRLTAIPARVRAGESLVVELRLDNRRHVAVTVMFGAPLYLHPDDVRPIVRVLDASGTDVTHGGECGIGRSSGSGDYLIEIGAGGSAHLSLPWTPVQQVGRPTGDGDCTIVREPLAPGRYTLTAHLPFERTLDVGEIPRALAVPIEVLAEPG